MGVLSFLRKKNIVAPAEELGEMEKPADPKKRKRIMVYVKESEERERHGPPNETILSEVMPITYCGEFWSETWRARIGLKYDEQGILKHRILYEYDDEDRLVRKEILRTTINTEKH